MIEAIKISGIDDQYDHIIKIRNTVYPIGDSIHSSEFMQIDKTSIHVLVYIEGIPAGTGRVHMTDAAMVDGIGVIESFRKQYIGDLITRLLIFEAFDQGYNVVFTFPQRDTEPFFEKIGFKPVEKSGMYQITQQDVVKKCK